MWMRSLPSCCHMRVNKLHSYFFFVAFFFVAFFFVAFFFGAAFFFAAFFAMTLSPPFIILKVLKQFYNPLQNIIHSYRQKSSVINRKFCVQAAQTY